MVLRRITGDEPPDGKPQPQNDANPPMLGHRASLAGVMELVEAQFNAEYGPGQITDPEEQRAAVRDVVDYVLAVESIKLDRAGRFAVIEAVYNDLFGAGPLDQFVADETIIEIEVAGSDRIDVQRIGGEMERSDAQFSDAAHLERFIARKLATAGVPPNYAEPVIEVGLEISRRPARLTVTAAPISPARHVHLRLHPTQPPDLAALVEHGMLTGSGAEQLQRILADGRGLMIAGEAGSGKTTLLQALLPLLPPGGAVVERALELRIPPDSQRFVAVPPLLFADQIFAALESRPAWLALDEARFDESAAMWAALSPGATAPQCLWAVRGATDPLRLRTAFSMAVRRAHPAIDQEAINGALLARLPCVAVLARHERKPVVLRIGEWRSNSGDLSQLELRQVWPT